MTFDPRQLAIVFNHGLPIAEWVKSIRTSIFLQHSDYGWTNRDTDIQKLYAFLVEA
jgi:hypothetical protein